MGQSLRNEWRPTIHETSRCLRLQSTTLFTFLLCVVREPLIQIRFGKVFLIIIGFKDWELNKREPTQNPPNTEKRTNIKINLHTNPGGAGAIKPVGDTLLKGEPVLSALNHNQIKANQRHLWILLSLLVIIAEISTVSWLLALSITLRPCLGTLGEQVNDLLPWTTLLSSKKSSTQFCPRTEVRG